MLGVLLALALLGLISLGSAARNWSAVWHGLDDLALALESVEPAGDRSTVVITLTVFNESSEPLEIHELDTGLRLSGRSISGTAERYNDLILDPGDSVTLDSTLQVTPSDVPLLDERLESGDERWNVSGRISVSVQDLSEPIWVPIRYHVETD